jgi:apolipoprotein N-acyltransferase
MQENEFEKRLQEEMEEFRLRPSEVVWNKIEDELKKKKRRRVVFFIFLLAGLSLVGYSGYNLFTPGKKNPVAKDVAATNNNVPNSQQVEPTDDDAQKSIPDNQKTITTQKQAKDQQEIIVPA